MCNSFKHMVALPLLQANMPCDSEVAVQNECALRFWIISKPPPTVEYVKAISAIIGASHVLAVFEEDDAIKVFFDDQRFVDTLIKKGIHVLGHHVRCDYVVPPGIKVILSNVDPVIPNIDVMKLLSSYGSVVSPVVRPPICDDVEFCHIGYGVRSVYMVLEGVLPSRLELKQGHQVSYIKIEIEDNTNDVPIKPSHSESDDEEVTMNTVPYDPTPGPSVTGPEVGSNTPVVVSVQSATEEGPDELKMPPPSPSKFKIPGRRVMPGLTRTRFPGKRKRLTSAAQAAKKITQNVKWGRKRTGPLKKPRRGRPPIKLVLKASTSSSSSESDRDAATSNHTFFSNAIVQLTPTKYLLDKPSLMRFLEEVKHQRAPLELAKKYLGGDCNTSKVYNLIDQLQKFSEMQHSQNLKLRIGRLIKCLNEAIEKTED